MNEWNGIITYLVDDEMSSDICDLIYHKRIKNGKRRGREGVEGEKNNEKRRRKMKCPPSYSLGE